MPIEPMLYQHRKTSESKEGMKNIDFPARDVL